MPYRVVARFGKRLASVWAPGKARVFYERDVWVNAPAWLDEQGYFLTYFRTLEDAERWNFIAITPGRQLWECKVREVFVDLPNVLSLDSLVRGYLKVDPVERWPAGTQMARAIKLVRRIE